MNLEGNPFRENPYYLKILIEGLKDNKIITRLTTNRCAKC
jgi:hypothetical protein